MVTDGKLWQEAKWRLGSRNSRRSAGNKKGHLTALQKVRQEYDRLLKERRNNG